MTRILFVSLLSGLAGSAALAQDASPSACILTATETITAPRKPNLFAMELSCGNEPDSEQQAASVSVANTDNAADALNVVLALGYEIEGATTMNSYAGGAIVSYYTLVKEVEAVEAPVEEAAPEASEEEGDGLEDMGDLPEAGDGEGEGEGEGEEAAAEEAPAAE